jgi:hypothetical protein
VSCEVESSTKRCVEPLNPQPLGDGYSVESARQTDHDVGNYEGCSHDERIPRGASRENLSGHASRETTPVRNHPKRGDPDEYDAEGQQHRHIDEATRSTRSATQICRSLARCPPDRAICARVSDGARTSAGV